MGQIQYADDDVPGDGEPPDDERAARPRSTGGSVLAAAMLGVGKVLEPDKTEVQIEIEAPGDPDERRITLDFGELPPLR